MYHKYPEASAEPAGVTRKFTNTADRHTFCSRTDKAVTVTDGIGADCTGSAWIQNDHVLARKRFEQR